MSQSRRNPKKEKFPIELSQVVSFLRLIAAMTGTLLILSLIFFMISDKTSASTVAYVMTIFVNMIVFLGSLIGSWKLDQKDEELQEKEQLCSSTKYGE